MATTIVNRSQKTPAAQRHGLLWWLGRIVLGLFALLVLLAVASALFQMVASARERSAYPPPGQLVDIGGTQLHLVCQGSGSTTVILEAALGDNSTEWAWVQPQVAQFARVCAYDRAGMGWSAASRTPRDSATIASELKTLLTQAGVTGPYVMVGHSIGGLYVREFAAQYPNDVVGVVLVDSSHEDQFTRMPQDFLPVFDFERQMYALCSTISPFGGQRLLFGENPALPADLRAAAAALQHRGSYCAGSLAEFDGIAATAAQVQQSGSLGDRPLVVVTAGIGMAATESLPPGVTRDALQRADLVWNELQTELLGLSTKSTQIIADQSSHYVPLMQPDLVVQAIRRVADGLQ